MTFGILSGVRLLRLTTEFGATTTRGKRSLILFLRSFCNARNIEFYTVAINELILTTIAGICSVSIVSFLFIPHWTGVLFISPLITALYIDLLGAMQFAGISINVVTYVCLVISVGLLVDFIMHILLSRIFQ